MATADLDRALLVPEAPATLSPSRAPALCDDSDGIADIDYSVLPPSTLTLRGWPLGHPRFGRLAA